jgi:hypothetical protein
MLEISLFAQGSLKAGVSSSWGEKTALPGLFAELNIKDCSEQEGSMLAIPPN